MRLSMLKQKSKNKHLTTGKRVVKIDKSPLSDMRKKEAVDRCNKTCYDSRALLNSAETNDL